LLIRRVVYVIFFERNLLEKKSFEVHQNFEVSMSIRPIESCLFCFLRCETFKQHIIRGQHAERIRSVSDDDPILAWLPYRLPVNPAVDNPAGIFICSLDLYVYESKKK
jgi:hypothetical protein